MEINKTSEWIARQANDARFWMANNKENFKPWITKKVAPAVMQSVANGAVNAFCARLFTSVPSIGIGVFVSNATLVNSIANGVFKYDHEGFLEGKPKDVLNFSAKTATMIYVPSALTTALGYEVNPSDVFKVGLIMVVVSATVMTGASIHKMLVKRYIPKS